ncbi:sigma-54 dependent transcriptional regulator [bacterium]|nr:sigma-54 dependent transcriptional regulator [bacterium]
MPNRILILDDEPKMGALLARSLEREGHEVVASTKPAEALERLKAERFDVLLTDLRMPGMDGLEVLNRTKAISPQTEVILMTAYASVVTAREALTRGAVDYLVKPVSAENDLKPLLRRLLSADAEPVAAPAASSKPAATPKEDLVISKSPAMRDVLRKLDKIAKSDASILLRGESGTGKEVLADQIQRRSKRANGPYLKVNCGALPETLLESELFGHVKGAFTGAVGDREGLFAAANGGTLMLDEIGEVSLPLQVKLLRVLQSGDYQRVGESRALKTDVRLIAATNRDLEKMIESGEFRQDLYYRLNVVPIFLPPLRERKEDLEQLVEYFAKRFADGEDVQFTDDAWNAILDYHWPGNIRELENAVEHALVLGEPAGIEVEDLPVALQQYRQRTGLGGSQPAKVGEETLEDIEKRCLVSALTKTGGNRTRAAELLGITRRTLGYRLKKYELEDEADRISRSGSSGGGSE